MIKYLREKFSKPNKDEVVILVHGLLRTKYSMYRLGRYLKRHGYSVYLYGYPSTKFSITELSSHMHGFLNDFITLHSDKKIHFVTHSMGGIISREALSNFSHSSYSPFGYLVMLAPPNQGSPVANLMLKRFPFLGRLLKPLAQLSDAPDSYIHQVQIPTNVSIGVIAAKYDQKVPLDLTHINGEKDHIILRTNHTLIINSRKAKKAILNFITNGNFMIQ